MTCLKIFILNYYFKYHKPQRWNQLFYFYYSKKASR